jgi:hypothetical protein
MPVPKNISELVEGDLVNALDLADYISEEDRELVEDYGHVLYVEDVYPGNGWRFIDGVRVPADATNRGFTLFTDPITLFVPHDLVVRTETSET